MGSKQRAPRHLTGALMPDRSSWRLMSASQAVDRVITLVARASHRVRGDTPCTAASREGTSGTVVAAVVMLAIAGCAGTERVSSPSSSSTVAAPVDQPHTRFDVLFARDIIEHGAQTIALSDLLIGKDGVEGPVIEVVRRITAGNTRRTTDLQALLLDWGFAPMTVSPAAPAAEPGEPAQPGEHPLASEVDYRVVRDSVGLQATDEFLRVMIRQNEFTITVARSQLQNGSHPGALAIARSLIQDQQSENSAMRALTR